MKKLKFVYRMNLEFSSPVTRHYFALRCVPGDSPCQTVTISRMEVSPVDYMNRLTDGFGNQKLSGSCMAPHSSFGYLIEGIALVEGMKIQRCALHPMYRLPSRYTMPGPAIREFASEASRVCQEAGAISARDQAVEVMKLLYNRFTYLQGMTDIYTTAEQALVRGQGVCQDYAHIMTAVLRCMGIPARYVTGLMIGEGSSHAWTEVYTDGGWYGLDPTNCLHVDDYYIRLSVGRDFGDCPADRGCFCGCVQQKQNVYVNVEDITNDRDSSVNGTSGG